MDVDRVGRGGLRARVAPRASEAGLGGRGLPAAGGLGDLRRAPGGSSAVPEHLVFDLLLLEVGEATLDRMQTIGESIERVDDPRIGRGGRFEERGRPARLAILFRDARYR